MKVIKTNDGYMIEDANGDYIHDTNGDNLFDTHAQAQDVLDAHLMTFGIDADNGMI